MNTFPMHDKIARAIGRIVKDAAYLAPEALSERIIYHLGQYLFDPSALEFDELRRLLNQGATLMAYMEDDTLTVYCHLNDQTHVEVNHPAATYTLAQAILDAETQATAHNAKLEANDEPHPDDAPLDERIPPAAFTG